MKKHLIYFLILIIPLIVVALTGCESLNVSGIEIGKSTFIMAVGVDKAPDYSGNVRITTVAEKMIPMEGSTPKSGEESTIITVVEGKTIFDAARNLHMFSSKDVFWGHNSLILISEDAAREDIMKYSDFFIRDHELRLNAKVVIIKGTTAENFIKMGSTSNVFISKKINTLLEDTAGESISKSVELSDALSMFENGSSSAYLPFMELANVENKNKDDIDKKDIGLLGLALFKNDKLCDFAILGAGRGVNWINHNVKSGIIVVHDQTGDNVSLEIITASRKIKPELKNGVLNVTIEIEETSNLDEQFSGEDLFTTEILKSLEEQQNNVILQEVQSAIYLAQPKGLDPFGIGDAVYHKYPLEWEKMKSNWEEIYKGTEIVIKVNSRIAKAYMFNEPIRSK